MSKKFVANSSLGKLASIATHIKKRAQSNHINIGKPIIIKYVNNNDDVVNIVINK